MCDLEQQPHEESYRRAYDQNHKRKRIRKQQQQGRVLEPTEHLRPAAACDDRAGRSGHSRRVRASRGVRQLDRPWLHRRS